MNRKAVKASPSIDQLPPHSIEAEQGVLGCILLDPETNINRCPELLPHREESFYDHRHIILYTSIIHMALERRKIDHITLIQYLRDHRILDEAGGSEYLMQLPDKTPSASNLQAYTEILVAKAALRKFIRSATHWTAEAFQANGDWRQILESADRDVHAAKLSVHPGPGVLPEMLDGSAFVDSVIPTPTELVKGLLHQGLKFSIGGGSKTCKSWVLIDLAVSVATGVEWLGMMTTKCKVLFVNLEIHEAFFRKRMARVLKQKEINLTPGQLDVWNLRGFNASAEVLIPKIIARTADRGYGLIVLDPIYKTYGTLKENAAEDMTRLMDRFESLCRQTGAALGFAAHFSKGNQAQKDALDRISGSGVFARDPDTIMTLTALEGDNCFAFEAGGLRNLAPFKPFGVRWNYPLMTRDDTLDPSNLKKIGTGRPKAVEDSQVAALLSDKPLSTAAWQKLAAGELGVSKAAFYRTVKSLQSSHTIVQSATDRTWSLHTRFATEEPPLDLYDEEPPAA